MHRELRLFATAIVITVFSLAAATSVLARNTGLRFVANEKSSTITVLDINDELIRTVPSCARPRGMHFTADRTAFFVGCADDDVIAIYDTATQELVDRIR
jgi:DNA-binding beta-propeller fold protein YncE